MSDVTKHLGKDTPIVTIGDVERWQIDLTEKRKLRNTLDSEIPLLEKKIEAARFLSDGALLDRVIISESPEPEDGNENMGEAAIRILQRHRALSHQEIITELRKIDRFQAMLDKNPGYYYTMISRLTKRGDVVKRRKKLYLPKNEAPSEGNPEGAS